MMYFIIAMVVADHLARHYIILQMLSLGLLDNHMRYEESPKSLWLITEEQENDYSN
jgi:hypothetical protein